MKKYLFLLLLLPGICFASEKEKSAEEEKLGGVSQPVEKKVFYYILCRR